MDQDVKHKKLVYVINYVGAQDTQHYFHVINLLNKLETLGWDVVLVSEKGGRGRRSVHGREVIYLSENGGIGRYLRLVALLLKLRRRGFRLFFVRISRAPALIAGLVARVTGARLLYWLSSSNQDLDQALPPLRRLSYNVQMRAILALLHRFVTGPQTMVEYFRTALNVPPAKSLLLYNDVDIARFSPAGGSRSADDGRSILFVHSLSPNKEATRYFPAIVQALARDAAENGPITLTIVGDGKERPVLEAMASPPQPGLTIRFAGAVPNAEVMAYYAAADLFVMPSYREGFPRVIVEAMAMGLPIVATDAGGTRDIMGSAQQAYIVSRDDADGFARQVVALLNDRAARRALADENAAHVQRYSTDAVAQMYDDKLQRVLTSAEVA